MDERDSLVELYFSLGFSNQEILECIALGHGFIVSIRTLKRITKRLGLFRRKRQSDIVEVAVFILNEITNKSGGGRGYRWMHLKCIQSGMIVSQKNVRLLMKILDPEGVDLKKRHRLRRRQYRNSGPNAVWHIDGCDKLAPYGIYIHGCVDGFSRYVVWMHASFTNKDPKVVGGYYIKAIDELQKCPRVIRSDQGTENGLVCEIQHMLRSHHSDQRAGNKSFLFGRSTSNQRIEWMWGLNRKEGIQSWINLFQSLDEDGIYTGDFLDKNLIRFCFTDLVQETLDDIKHAWNSHKIQSYRNQTTVCGRPVIMYNLPQKYGVRDFSCTINDRDLTHLRDRCTFHSEEKCDKDVHDVCFSLLSECGISLPTTPDDGSELYRFLRSEIRQLTGTEMNS